MAYATIADIPLTHGRLTLPRQGLWQVAAIIDTDVLLSGAVEVRWGGLSWLGTIVRAGMENGACAVRVVAGAGGLGKEIAPQGFRDAKLSALFDHLCSSAGEKLADNVEANLLAQQVGWFALPRVPVARALSAIAETFDLSWRFLPNGRLWIGSERWPAAAPTVEDVALDGLSQSAEVSMPVPSLLPGTTWSRQRVSRVEHLLTPNSIRSRVWFERAAG